MERALEKTGGNWKLKKDFAEENPATGGAETELEAPCRISKDR